MQAKKNPSALKTISLAIVALALGGCTPAGPRALLDGKALLERGQYEKAVEKLTLATSLMATNAQAWNYLGLACHQAGEVDRAAKAYRRALDLNRELVEAHFNLGCLWLEQNKPDAAKTEFTACTLRQANSVEGWLKLGAAQIRLAESAAAAESFQKALRLTANHPEALNGLGLASAQRKRPREAAQYFEAALKQRPDYPPALLNLATVLQRDLNDPATAVKKYRTYLALTPRPADWEAVNTIVQSLEPKPAQVAAARSIVTNPPPQVATKPPETKPQPSATNPPPQTASKLIEPKPQLVATSAPPQIAAKPSEPKPQPVTSPAPVKSNPPPALAQPAPAPNSATTTVVRLAPGPVIRTTPVDTQPQPARLEPTTAAKPETVTENTSAPVVEPTTQGAEKRGFFSRLNPFRRSTKPSAKATPLPTTAPSTGLATKAAPLASTDSLPAPAISTESAPASAGQESSSPAPRTFPRYTYLSPAPPSAGNREKADAAFARGTKAQAAQKWTEAAKAFQQAAQLDGSYFEAHYNLGLVQYRQRNYSQALATWEKALALLPDSAEARYMFALTLNAAGYAPDAAQESEKILAANTNDTRAHLLLGNLCAEQLRDKARARLHYQRVLELDAHHPNATQIRYWLVANPA